MVNRPPLPLFAVIHPKRPFETDKTEAERPLLAHRTGRPVQDFERPAPGRVELRGGGGGG